MGVDQVKQKMAVAIKHFENELRNIRTGRAHPGMVEHVTVDVYGNPVSLKSVASISCPEARQILITPFDPKNGSLIAKAIEKANLGFLPSVEGQAIRIKIPPMTEEIRKKMVKLCDVECEKAKIAVRSHRKEGNELVRKQKAEGLISEDAVKKAEKQIQDLTDEFCRQVDEMTKKKKEEVAVI